MMKNPPLTLDDMLQTEDYIIYEAESTMSLQWRIINIHHVMIDRVTHGAIIQSWFDYLLDVLDPYLTEDESNSIFNEIEAKEKWHIDNDSIDDIYHDFSEVN